MSTKKINGIDYTAYLLSDEWRAIRRRVAKNRNYICQDCGKDIHIGYTVHHLTYKHFGNERDEDLLLLCEKCHKKLDSMIVHKKDYDSGSHKKTRASKIKRRCGNCANMVATSIKLDNDKLAAIHKCRLTDEKCEGNDVCDKHKFDKLQIH